MTAEEHVKHAEACGGLAAIPLGILPIRIQVISP